MKKKLSEDKVCCSIFNTGRQPSTYWLSRPERKNHMLRAIDQYFLSQEEPEGSSLQALRDIILAFDPHLSEAWKYGMPFYCYNGKMCCYLWTDKKLRWPYIGFVEGSSLQHPDLIAGKRARMKILLFDPGKDLPVKLIRKLLGDMVRLYVKGKR